MSAPVLVVGSTGRQGGATARALLAAGIPVRALVRDPESARARAVAALGAELVTGDLKVRQSLTEAAQGVRAVFSVQMAEPVDGVYDFDGELRQAVNLIGPPAPPVSGSSCTPRYRDQGGWPRRRDARRDGENPSNRITRQRRASRGRWAFHSRRSRSGHGRI